MLTGTVEATATSMTLDFTGSDTDGNLQASHMAAGTGKAMKTRTYSMKYVIEDGDKDCGVGCRK